ncbi:MAG TPA: trehalose-6-phosphate synthase, partial [Candidatus Polarisedimenticolia bacterium]|nr:trehalose-6-phosphate synthase [Candidatus Polarisedimenticolia bacterium]
RDGMNLIAKEYVAAQNPDAPGVLVLSRFAGAAESLTEAILVNPFIPSDSAAGVARALEMPLAERRERHAAMLRKVVDGSAAAWSEDFLADLESVRRPAGLRPEVSRIF